MWSSLVSDGKPGVNADEINRLKNLLKHYESENLRLIAELEAARDANKACIQSLGDADRVRQDLVKKIRTMEKTTKFDKIAADGIAKRSATFEFEATNLKTERATLIEEQIMNRAKVKILEESLNNDRSKLLKEMHQNELLKKNTISLETKLNDAEQSLIIVRTDLLDRIQKIETLASKVDGQSRVITAQSEELINMTREVGSLKESQRSLNEIILQQQQMISEKHKDSSDFEHEVWRLRKELIGVSLTQSERALAHSQIFCHTNTQSSRANYSRAGGSRLSNRTSSLIIPPENFTAQPYFEDAMRPDGNDSTSFGTSSRMGRTSSQDNITQELFMSPLTAPYRPHTSTHGKATRNHKSTLSRTAPPEITAYSASSNLQGMDSIKSYNLPSVGNNNLLRLPSKISSLLVEPVTELFEIQEAQNNGIAISSKTTCSNSKKLSVGPKTRYLGSGLSLKHDTEPAFSPTGSAKQVLKKIMDDFNRNN